jgi:hypothetical protein
MNFITRPSPVSVAMVLMLLAGCSQESTLGTQMVAEGSGIAAIGDRWTEGDKLVQQGRSEIERGNEMIAEGRQLVRSGEANVQRGESMKAEAEADYQAQTGSELPVPE